MTIAVVETAVTGKTIVDTVNLKTAAMETPAAGIMTTVEAQDGKVAISGKNIIAEAAMAADARDATLIPEITVAIASTDIHRIMEAEKVQAAGRDQEAATDRDHPGHAGYTIATMKTWDAGAIQIVEAV